MPIKRKNIFLGILFQGSMKDTNENAISLLKLKHYEPTVLASLNKISIQNLKMTGLKY